MVGGTPSQVWMVGGYLPTRSRWWGVPHPRSACWGGTPPTRSGCWGIPPWPGLDGGLVWMVGGTWGTPPPPPMRQSSITSTCYAAGGMPLAFTQEDFLVSIVYNETKDASIIATLTLMLVVNGTLQGEIMLQLTCRKKTRTRYISASTIQSAQRTTVWGVNLSR